MFYSDRWQKGRAETAFTWREIPENERCFHCNGGGEECWTHTFLGGYSYIPCEFCAGTGKKRGVFNEFLKR